MASVPARLPDPIVGLTPDLLDVVDGDWTETEFVVVEPGQRIVASYDGCIVKAEG